MTQTDEGREADRYIRRADDAIRQAKAMRAAALKMRRLAKLEEWTDEQRERWPKLVEACRNADHRLVRGEAL